MIVVIGSARCDERKKYSGGKKGDQTQPSVDDYKGEVSMQKFYIHSKGWIIIRAKSPGVAVRISQAMQRACNNVRVGYSQSDRYAILYVGTATKKDTNCDCSTLIRQCVKEATGKDPGDFTTANEVDKLLATKLFDKVEFTSEKDLYTGDILVTETKGHTAAVVNGKARLAKHIQLNYKLNNYYTVVTTALNVRLSPVDGKVITALKKGDNILCKGLRRVGDAIWMCIGKDENGRERWCCADNGTKKYIGE